MNNTSQVQEQDLASALFFDVKYRSAGLLNDLRVKNPKDYKKCTRFFTTFLTEFYAIKKSNLPYELKRKYLTILAHSDLNYADYKFKNITSLSHLKSYCVAFFRDNFIRVNESTKFS